MKKFLVIGNQNAITHKEIFPLIKRDEVWLGATMNGHNRWFKAGKDYPLDPKAYGYKEIDGDRFFFVNGVCWYTNLDYGRRHNPLALKCKFSSESYTMFDNYSAINVDNTTDIPSDYEGIMGVPITFLYKYCPEQFEVVGCTYSYGDCGIHTRGTQWGGLVEGKDIYKRIFIRKR